MVTMAHHEHMQLGSKLHKDGVDFAVWAPFAKEVRLLLTVEFDAKPFAMEPSGDGYWHVKNIDAKPGQSYLYEITTKNGEKLKRNDPYARQLTDSDNGASVIIEHTFDWEEINSFKAAKQNEAIIYELHIGTFNRPDSSTPGTFYTAIERLQYLADLGVNYIELMPVTSMAQSHGWGYAPNYIFSVEHAYGGRRGLLEFVKACHAHGIGVILDVVYNHFYVESDLWQFDGWSENDRGGIYFYNDVRGDTPWGGRPDYGRHEVRQFILDNVAMWLTEFKIDGLRIDSTIFMRNANGKSDAPETDIPDAYSLLADMNTLAHKINPNALMIAEDNSSTASIVEPVNQQGMGFDAQWEIGFPHVIRDSLAITNNPDQTRLQGIEYELDHTYTPNVFDKVIYSDSHDTAANGSVRLNEAVTPGNAASVYARQRTLLASAITLTAPGIPMLLQGQEFLQDGSFNDWQMLDWEKTEQFDGIVLAHKHLIDLRLNRHGNTAGLLGNYTSLFHKDEINSVIGYHRWNTGGANDDTIIIANFDKHRLDSYSIQLPTEGAWRVRFNSSWNGYSSEFFDTPLDILTTDGSGMAILSMSEYSVIIASKEAL
jgi:1,4-alpha-glucan branching enzyme